MTWFSQATRPHKPLKAETVIAREIIPGHGYVSEEGVTSPPFCCTGYMVDDGDCDCGCCDDYLCNVCGRQVRIEWPD